MPAFARRDARAVEKRRHQRLAWAAAGRFVLDDRIEHRCRAIDVSAAGVALLAPTRGDIGQRIVCYLDELGRLEGQIVRLFENGFAVALNSTVAKRQKLARQLALRADRPLPAGTAFPSMHRTPVGRTVAILDLPDRRRVRVQVLDVRDAVVTVLCPLPLEIGADVMLGGQPAHVTRVAQALIGLRFSGPAGDHAAAEDLDAERDLDLVDRARRPA